MKLSAVLKEKTEISHQQLEKLLVGKLKSISTIADYKEILAGFYGFIKPLEEKISKNIDINLLPDYSKRRKSDALKLDLEQLEADVDCELADDIPIVEDAYQAFGALYVLEGSTLGGKIISRMVADKLNLNDLRGLSFFYSYGEKTVEMWEEFKAILDSKVPEDARQTVIDTAEQTFIKFKNWLA